MKSQSRKLLHCEIAIAGLAFLWSGSSAFAQQAESQVMTTTTSDTEQAPKLPNDELDSLVAPIALYSDPLLAQTLAASTYPLEIIQLQQWMDRNKNLQGKALADAVAKQPWDPSVQALVATPDVVQRMAGNIQWTTDLGNAFLAQQSDVMDAVQRLRGKAESKGTLKTSAQQKVETKTVEGGKQVIVVEPSSPDVVYVPSYDPEVVYGPPPPAYPYYPYTYNNKYVNNYNKNVNKNFNQANFNKQGGAWQHNAQHRGNAPYGNRQTANKYGGAARGQGGAGGAGARPGAAGAGTRPGGGGGGALAGAGGAGSRPGGGTGAGNRPGGGAGAGNRPSGGAGAGNRPGGGAGAGTRPGGGAGAGARPGGGTPKNQVGNRSASSRPSSASLGGGSGNYARASSSRGGHSMGGGGGGRR